MKFERAPLDQVDWPQVDAVKDRTFCQRRFWPEFVRETHAGEPVVARLDDRGTTIGYFTGVIVRKLGLPIMGSPFLGFEWTTPYMGFNLQPGVARADAVGALLAFVFGELTKLPAPGID